MAQAVKIIEDGKLVIPASMSRAMGITRGDTVVVELLSNSELRVRPLASAIRPDRAHFGFTLKSPTASNSDSNSP